MDELGTLGLQAGLQTELVRSLLKGSRTIPEMVELLFGVGRSSTDFHAHYMRVWRSMRELEARGIVSAPILGRDKPYRLTEHGLGLLLGVLQGRRRIRAGVFPRSDLSLFAATFVLGALYCLYPERLPAVLLIFVFLLGFSTSRILISLRGVW